MKILKATIFASIAGVLVASSAMSMDRDSFHNRGPKFGTKEWDAQFDTPFHNSGPKFGTKEWDDQFNTPFHNSGPKFGTKEWDDQFDTPFFKSGPSSVTSKSKSQSNNLSSNNSPALTARPLSSSNSLYTGFVSNQPALFLQNNESLRRQQAEEAQREEELRRKKIREDQERREKAHQEDQLRRQQAEEAQRQEELRRKKLRLEQERQEQERLENARQEELRRKKKAQEEQELLEQERQEELRRKEKARLEQERLEKERQEELRRKEKLRQEEERLEKARQEEHKLKLSRDLQTNVEIKDLLFAAVDQAKFDGTNISMKLIDMMINIYDRSKAVVGHDLQEDDVNKIRNVVNQHHELNNDPVTQEVMGSLIGFSGNLSAIKSSGLGLLESVVDVLKTTIALQVQQRTELPEVNTNEHEHKHKLKNTLYL